MNIQIHGWPVILARSAVIHIYINIAGKENGPVCIMFNYSMALVKLILHKNMQKLETKKNTWKCGPLLGSCDRPNAWDDLWSEEVGKMSVLGMLRILDSQDFFLIFIKIFSSGCQGSLERVERSVDYAAAPEIRAVSKCFTLGLLCIHTFLALATHTKQSRIKFIVRFW